MASKLTAQRAAVIRSLTSSVRQHGDPIAASLEQRLFPDGVPPGLTLAMVIAALAAAAEREYGRLAMVDVALAKELTDDAQYRDERDDSVADLRVVVQRSRDAMSAGFGKAAISKVGLEGRQPDVPDQLVQLARAAADLVESAELGAPALPTDRAAVAAQLRAGADRVDRSLGDVSREEREAQTLRNERDRIDLEVRRVYGGFADAFAGFASAVGLDEIANRVRPTARRRAGLPEEEDVLDPPVDPSV